MKPAQEVQGGVKRPVEASGMPAGAILTPKRTDGSAERLEAALEAAFWRDWLSHHGWPQHEEDHE